MKSLNLQFSRSVILNAVKNLIRSFAGLRMTVGLLLLSSIFCVSFALASSDGILPPPIINLYNKDASNNEIFYIGGTTVVSEGDVIVYMQRSDGSALSYNVKADKNGNWFYSSPEFLHTGEYIVWTQVRNGDFVSPPSPQININVLPVAYQFAGLRITYDFFYFLSVALFLLIFVPALIFGFYHWRGHKIKSVRLRKEIIDIEQTVKRGFTALKKDIESELLMIKKLKIHDSYSEDIKNKEEKMMKDLQVVKKYIGKEVYDVEKLAS